MVQIDKETIDKLHTYAGKVALAKHLIDQGNEVAGMAVYDDEWHALRGELVKEFLPLLATLVNAGLISVGIDGDGERFTGHVIGDATRAYDYGNICLHAAEIEAWDDKPILDH